MGSFKQNTHETFLGIFETARENWGDFVQFLKEAWPLLVFLIMILMGIWWYADPPLNCCQFSTTASDTKLTAVHIKGLFAIWQGKSG
jgi:hypothetical protein